MAARAHSRNPPLAGFFVQGSPKMIRILVVCMGNICRSPMASSVLQSRLKRAPWAGRVAVDSAGTYAGHAGEPADARALAVARAAGHEAILNERARRVTDEDFERFDLILAMDRDNLMHLQLECPPSHHHKLHLFLAYAGVAGATEVPDPYYGGAEGFQRVLRLCEAGADGVLRRLQAEGLV
jgi:protein-tyrosine phosphatase